MIYFVLFISFFALIFDKLNIFLFLILSSILHEMGHIIACLISGNKPKIDISLFGIKLSNYPNNKYKKLFILVSGPLVNLILIFISILLNLHSFKLNRYVFMCVNIVLLIFNILPISFLDGGQIISVFCDNHHMRKFLDLISFLLIIMAIFAVSSNKIISLIVLFIFVVYYILNSINIKK